MKTFFRILFRYSLAAMITLAILYQTVLAAAPDSLGMLRAIHIGGNWGRNPFGIAEQPEDYYQFLGELNVNWVGISVALHIESSMDSTVERVYEDVPIPTFRDEPLIDAIRGFRQHGLNVYLTLAFETQEAAESQYPVHRTQLGDPFAYEEDPDIQRQYWPWDPDHSDHAAFVESFFRTYTEQAMYFARIAESEGVGLFSLGTETNRLFRTRAYGDRWPNDFQTQLKTMVDSVRSVYSGLVSFDLHWGALADTEFFGPGCYYLWEDLGLDVVGISAYFQLAEQPPTSVMTVSELETSWEDVFNRYLLPLKETNPERPILFLEFGYVDDIESPYFADSNALSDRVFQDNDSNGLDDGEETQANILEAFFKVNDRYDQLVQGVFLYGNHICSRWDWENTFGQLRTHAIRLKLAEEVVRSWYEAYEPVAAVPVLIAPPDGAQDVPPEVELIWSSLPEAALYHLQVSEQPDFSSLFLDVSDIADTSYVCSGLSPETTYYWRVQVQDAAEWSESFSFRTAEGPPEVMGEYYVDVYNSEKAYNGTTLFTDAHDPENPKVVEVDMNGNIVWEYILPEELRSYTQPGFDAELLSNQNISIVLPRKGIYEIDRSGSIVWKHEDSKVSHDADRLANGNTIYVYGDNDTKDDPQVKEVDSSGNLVWAWYAKDYFDVHPFSNISREGWTHTNAVIRMDDGNTLINLRNFQLTVIVDPEGSVVKQFNWRAISGAMRPDPHDPEILPDGHLLIALQNDSPYQGVEIDMSSEDIVWSYTQDGLRTVRDCDRLPNGNTLMVGVLVEDDESVIFEVTSSGEIVWRLKITDTPATLQPGWFYKAQRISTAVAAVPVLIAPPDGAQDVPLEVELIWGSLPEAALYHLQVSDQPDFSSLFLDVSDIADTSYVCSGLSPETTYYWRVQVQDAAGEGGWSESFSFETKQGVQTELAGDFDGDGRVWTEDFVLFVTQFGRQQGDEGFDPIYDLDEDGRIWTGDFARFVAQFGKTSGAGKTVVALSPVGKNQDAELVVSVQTRGASSLSSEGMEFTVELSVENAAELRGYGLTLDYEPEVLEFLGAAPGKDNLLNKAGGSTPLFLVISNPDRPGQVWIANALADFKLAQGKGLLASLSFRTRGRLSGSSLPVRLSGVELFDAQLRLNSLFGENLMKQIQLLPAETRLVQNCPNPFNAATCISYQLAQPTFVTLKVYNLSGQLVKTLVKEEKPAGWHSVRWDGRDSSGRAVASGIYLCHFTAGEFSKVHKMLLLK